MKKLNVPKLFILVIFVFAFLCTLLLTGMQSANAQRIEMGYGYTNTTASAGNAASGNATMTDSSGNVYVSGNFGDPADFDPSAGVDNHTPQGNADGYLTKYNPDGSYAWTKTWGGIDSDQADTLAVDSSDNVYVSGAFHDTVDFDPSAGVDNHTSAGSYDNYLIKINADGSYDWTKTWGGTGVEVANTLVIDSNDNIYAAGEFQTTVDFDPSAGVDNHTSNGGDDVFITKFNSSGTYVSTKTWGGVGAEYPFTLALGDNDDLYVAGAFDSTADFDSSAGLDNHTPVGSFDAYLAKYNADGTYAWTKTWGGVGFDVVLSVAVDSNGNPYMSGMFAGTVDFDPSAGVDNHTSNGGDDAYVIKYNADGTYGWTKTWGGGASESADSVVVDSQDTIRVASYFSGTVDFDPSASVDNHTYVDGSDVALSSFADDGVYLGMLTFGGNGYESVNDMKVDSSDNIYLTGGVDSTSIDFNPFAGTDTQTPTGNGDMFLVKLTAAHYQNVTGLPAGLKLIDPATGFDMADTASGGTLRSSSVVLRLTTTAGVPIADVTVDMSVDRDWSGVTAASDAASFKSVVDGLINAPGTIGTHSLYVPKLAGDNTVYVCPDATILSQVSTTCSNVLAYTDSDSNVSIVNIGGLDYWLVTGLSGAGGISGNVLAAATTAELANTGDDTLTIIAAALGTIVCAAAGLAAITRRQRSLV